MATAPPVATISSVELLEFKSWVLAQVERVSLCSEGLVKVKKYIAEEVEMDVKVNMSRYVECYVASRWCSHGDRPQIIDTHLSPFNTRFRSAAHYESLPREATIFEENYQELLQLIRDVLHEGADCFHTKKLAFQTQLKKIRDNANVAIRNAMQVPCDLVPCRVCIVPLFSWGLNCDARRSNAAKRSSRVKNSATIPNNN